MLGQRALTADVQDRTFRTERGGDTGNRVGAAGTGRGDYATQLAGLTCVTVGGVRRGLFMAHVDDTNTFIEATIVNIDNMPAAEREYGIDAFGLECLGDEVTA